MNKYQIEKSLISKSIFTLGPTRLVERGLINGDSKADLKQVSVKNFFVSVWFKNNFIVYPHIKRHKT